MNAPIYIKKLLDFHTHSTFSDGADTPTRLVERAKKHGVSALALTDHNVIAGLEEFRHACDTNAIFAIPFGTEIYAELPSKVLSSGDNEAPDLILLGKNVMPRPFRDYQQILRKYRQNVWLPKTFMALEGLGFFVPRYDFKKVAENLAVPDELFNFIRERNNFDVLVKYIQSQNLEISREEIRLNKKRFIGKYLYSIGRPAYVKRLQGFGVDDAIGLAEDMNCKLFIAHPGGEYGFLSDTILNYYIQKGIHGIEVRNYFNTSEQNRKFDELAVRYNLVRSGGSDCHGSNGSFKIGMYDRPQNQLSEGILEELLDALP